MGNSFTALEAYASNIICLPLCPGLQAEEIQRVACTLTTLLRP